MQNVIASTMFMWRAIMVLYESRFRIMIKHANPIIINITDSFGIMPNVIFPWGRAEMRSAILNNLSYILCAKFNAVGHPNTAQIVPIITHGIRINENSGKNIIFPIIP